MQRLIDADALCRHLSDWQYGSMTDGKHDVEYGVIENVIEGIEKEPTIDAVPLDGSFKKMSKGDYLIYDRHWLYEHFDQEIDIQRSVMESMGYEAVMELDDSELLFQRELWDRECEDDEIH